MSSTLAFAIKKCVPFIFFFCLCSKNGVPVELAGGKDTPIVIEDEDDAQPTEKTEVATSIKVGVAPTEVFASPNQDSAQPEVKDSNLRRRSLIIEQSPSIAHNNDLVSSGGWT